MSVGLLALLLHCDCIMRRALPGELHSDCIADAWEISLADGEIGDMESNLAKSPKE
jgi:uncharacterized tellurite resistance protein B-like protein